jgi:hypothetical protein
MNLDAVLAITLAESGVVFRLARWGRTRGGQGRGRTADLRFFRPALYQLSYLTSHTMRTRVGSSCALRGRRDLNPRPPA